jgi:hypothetical protein
MADAIQTYSTSKYDNAQLGQITEAMMRSAKDSRRNFERRWYDNNFFDDGFHFRYLSRSQNKIVDLSERANLQAPMRAIPKASRQIRGMANLLVSQDYVSVIYPEKVQKLSFPDPAEYQQAVEEAKRVAKSSGHWIEEKFKEQDIKEQKIPHMVVLTGKHGISYLKIWPDPIEEAIDSTVRDAFDVYVLGSMTELKDLPFMGEGVPRSIAEIKADERFDPNQTNQISPENKHASSEIKDAYMRAQYGGEFNSAEYTATLIQKEFYVKEYLNDENVKRIRVQKDGDQILRRHTNSQGELKYGDPVLRQVFVAGNITLRGQYVNLPDFPYVDFRMEPGPLYQVPLIERFIPANKSLDMIASRVERYTHTMVTGSWSIKAGEPTEPNNSAGGQILKYRTTAPVQNQIAPIPPFVFNFMNMLGGFIEEQGVSLSTLGKIPQGVKAASAIESLKESEYASLVVATKQLKKTVKRIAEKMLDIADDYFVTPQTVYYLEKGEPQYFDVIGGTGLEKRKEIGVTNDLTGEEVPLKRDYHVEIEVQSGLGYTKEGKKAAAKELGDYLVQLAGVNMVSPEVVKVFFETLLKEYQFGPTEEIMEAMEEALNNGPMTDDELMKMKIAVIEVLKEAGMVGPEAEKRLVESTKVGMAEVLADTGLADKLANDPKTQMEIAKGEQEMKHKEAEHQLKMAQGSQEMQIKEEETGVDIQMKKAEKAQGMSIKEEQAKHNMKIKEKMVTQMAKQPKPASKGAKK